MVSFLFPFSVFKRENEEGEVLKERAPSSSSSSSSLYSSFEPLSLFLLLPRDAEGVQRGEEVEASFFLSLKRLATRRKRSTKKKNRASSFIFFFLPRLFHLALFLCFFPSAGKHAPRTAAARDAARWLDAAKRGKKRERRATRRRGENKTSAFFGSMGEKKTAIAEISFSPSFPLDDGPGEKPRSRDGEGTLITRSSLSLRSKGEEEREGEERERVNLV